jgi:hypothetical protein
VSEYLGRAAAAGVGWPIPAELGDDERLEAAVFGPKKGGPKAVAPAGDGVFHGELRRPGVTLSLRSTTDGLLPAKSTNTFSPARCTCRITGDGRSRYRW